MRISDWSSDVCSSDLFDFAGGEVGVRRLADRAADDEDRSAVRHRLRRCDDAFLVAGRAVRGADAGDDEIAAGPRLSRRFHFLARADDAVEPGFARERGEADDLIVRGAADADIVE